MASTLEVSILADLAIIKNAPSTTLYQTTTQSIPNNANTLVVWNTSTGDNWAGWSSSTPSRYTVQVAGWYMLTSTVQWSQNTTGPRHVEFYVNGVEQLNSLTVWTTPPASQYPQSANTIITYGNAGDYFSTNVYQNSGGALNLATVGAMTVSFVHF